MRMTFPSVTANVGTLNALGCKSHDMYILGTFLPTCTVGGTTVSTSNIP